MELFLIFVVVFLGVVTFLNVMVTNIIRSSTIHGSDQKRKYLYIVWGLPIAGIFIVITKINKDIKSNEKKMEEEIAPAIRELADRLKVLEADIQHEQGKKSVH